eukprot:TRINITY_DN2509_c0_g1_i22.p2 TRINITY_DN2509_c0_g1~~TRINITY_DN2509_c0_g1_i22.p2  ORF type:complete len:161 (-),score=33.29 TRINITY_DN2509_c0_g1_i22:756-1238(-)
MPKRSRTKNKKTAVKMKEEEEEEKEEYEVKVEEPGDFEKWRQQIIARNRAKLQSLGINTMLEEISQAVGDEKAKKVEEGKLKKVKTNRRAIQEIIEIDNPKRGEDLAGGRRAVKTGKIHNRRSMSQMFSCDYKRTQNPSGNLPGTCSCQRKESSNNQTTY